MAYKGNPIRSKTISIFLSLEEAKNKAVIRTFNADLKVNGDGAYAFVAQPDDNARHPGMVLIQEWWGIEPHIRDLPQELAVEGFVVAVPTYSMARSRPNLTMLRR